MPSRVDTVFMNNYRRIHEEESFRGFSSLICMEHDFNGRTTTLEDYIVEYFKSLAVKILEEKFGDRLENISNWENDWPKIFDTDYSQGTCVNELDIAIDVLRNVQDYQKHKNFFSIPNSSIESVLFWLSFYSNASVIYYRKHLFDQELKENDRYKFNRLIEMRSRESIHDHWRKIWRELQSKNSLISKRSTALYIKANFPQYKHTGIRTITNRLK